MTERKLPALLTDPNALWRKMPASQKQLSYLKRFDIEHQPDITAGEAANLLRPTIAEQERRQVHNCD